MFSNQSKRIGLPVTEKAIKEVKWIARIFFESRCAFATHLGDIAPDALFIVIGHFKFFIRNEKEPPVHREAMLATIPTISKYFSWRKTFSIVQFCFKRITKDKPD